MPINCADRARMTNAAAIVALVLIAMVIVIGVLA
jgi:hypothetical protein